MNTNTLQEDLRKEIEVTILKYTKGRVTDNWSRVAWDEMIDGVMSLSSSHTKRVREEEKQKILKKLKKVDQEGWKDAKHCSCLAYAIWKKDKTYKGGQK